MLWHAGVLALVSTLALRAQTTPSPLLARTIQEAHAFQQKASAAISEETLRQRSLGFPPHPHFAVGAAALPIHSRYILHEIVSQYSIGPLKGSSPPELVEFRELVSKDGVPVRTSESARRALLQDVKSGEERIRKHILEEFTS